MPRCLPFLLAVLLGLVGAAAMILLWFPSSVGDPATRPAPDSEAPPSEAELRELFLADPEAFEATKNLVLSLPRPTLSIQVDTLWWPKHRGWTKREEDRWWSPDAVGGAAWKDSEGVYEEAGISAEQHGELSAFLRRHAFLTVSRRRRRASETGEIAFQPLRGLHHAHVDRGIVWHEGGEPFSEDATFVRSETNRVPQRTREKPLPAEGWWIRTTTRD